MNENENPPTEQPSFLHEEGGDNKKWVLPVLLVVGAGIGAVSLAWQALKDFRAKLAGGS